MDTETKSMLAYSDIYLSLKALQATKPSASCGRGKSYGSCLPGKNYQPVPAPQTCISVNNPDCSD